MHVFLSVLLRSGRGETGSLLPLTGVSGGRKYPGLQREKGVMASVSRQPENPILILVLSEGRCGGTRGIYLLGGKLKARR